MSKYQSNTPRAASATISIAARAAANSVAGPRPRRPRWGRCSCSCVQVTTDRSTRQNANMQQVVDFGRSFVTQSALRFDTADLAEQGVPGNVCRAQILASCEVTRAGTANTFYLCQPCIGEHMYRENRPAGVEFQFQQTTVRRAGLRNILVYFPRCID